MSSALVSYLLVTGTLIAVAVLAVDAACRAAGRPRRWAPFGGLILLVALAIISPQRRQTTMPTATQGSTEIPPAAWLIEMDQPAMTTAAPVTPTVANPAGRITATLQMLPQYMERVLPRGPGTFFLTLWIATSALLLLFYVLVQVRFVRARRSWPVVELLGTRVRLSPRAGPAVVGAFRPDIVIPQWLLERDKEQVEMVLAHEREHVRARDPLMLASAWTCALALPWHPAAWWMLSRTRLAVEFDCDSRVLERGAARRSYGALLIDLAQQTSGLPVGATALSDRTTQLERRLLAMKVTSRSFTRAQSGAFAAIAIAMIVSACAVRMPATESDAPMPAEEERVLPVPPVAAPPIMIVDGVAQPTLTPEPASPSPGAQAVAPMIVVDGVIQMVPPAGEPVQPPVPSSPPLPPPATAAPQQVPVPTSNPMIIIDGVIQMSGDRAAGTRFPPTPPAQQTVRPPGRDTAFMVSPPLPPQTPRPGGRDTAFMVVPPLAQARPLIIVDGVIQMNPNFDITSLDLNKVVAIEVIRGDEAARLYGERARLAGVLNIRTTGGPAIRRDTTVRGGRGGGAGGAGAGLPPGTGAVRPGTGAAVLGQFASGEYPLFIVDGVLMSADSAGNLVDGLGVRRDITRDRIESVEVVRGAAAVALYGEKAKNGVVNIKTRR